MYEAVAAAAQQYEASGPGPIRTPGAPASECRLQQSPQRARLTAAARAPPDVPPLPCRLAAPVLRWPAGQGVNLEDAFARLHLARLCAYVVHSDQSAGDVSRDGAPFWKMLCLLAVR